MGLNGFLTIVRDLEKGSVLHIGDGKGSDALSKFTLNLKRSKANIKAVALDFGRPYSKWARESVPNAIVVYDHFHLIKLMNDKLDKIRRSTMLRLEDQDKKKLKNKRWLFCEISKTLKMKQKKN